MAATFSHGAWHIEGPRACPDNGLHVYAYLDGRMIGMLDCELRSAAVQLRMAYVSPPWRGTAVLHDMLAVLRRSYRRVSIPRAGRMQALPPRT